MKRDNKGRFVKGYSGNPKTEFKKGQIPWNFNMRGIQLSPHGGWFKQGNKICVGRAPWNKGLRGKKYLEHYKNGHPMKGKHHLDETKRKLSNFNIGQIPWNKNLTKDNNLSLKKVSEKYKIWRNKQILPIKDTSIEVKIQNFLEELNIEFFTHQYIKIEHGYQCDIFVPSLNLVIECDGNYWHKYPTRNDIDNIRTKELLEGGFKVLRLWEVEIKEMNIDEFEGLIYNLK